MKIQCGVDALVRDGTARADSSMVKDRINSYCHAASLPGRGHLIVQRVVRVGWRHASGEFWLVRPNPAYAAALWTGKAAPGGRTLPHEKEFTQRKGTRPAPWGSEQHL